MRSLALVLFAATTLLWGYILGALDSRVYDDRHDVAEAICAASRKVISHDWEEACAIAQDTSGERYTKYSEPSAATYRVYPPTNKIRGGE